MHSLPHYSEKFEFRHNTLDQQQVDTMLKVIGVDSIDQLIQQIIPTNLRLSKKMNLPKALSEPEFLVTFKKMIEQNQVFRSYIGMGYYNTVMPAVIARNIFENPNWYTPYTPYQAEVAQGRLEALMNFQTLISDLTGMEIANASLLDEATAAAEAMNLLYTCREKSKKDSHTFFVDKNVFPQTLAVLKTRATPLGIQLQIGDVHAQDCTNSDWFGMYLQNPDGDGGLQDYSDLIQQAHKQEVCVAMGVDLMSLLLVTPPGEMDADIAVGSSQRFGTPMGFGGPHAAFFATKAIYKRFIPGRIIGASMDRDQKLCYRMALQTREQHIRRERATSNICTAQALLANIVSMYAVYHGPKRLKNIALRIHGLTQTLEHTLTAMGIEQLNTHYFDTLKLAFSAQKVLRTVATNQRMNFRYIDDRHVGIALDETTSPDDVERIVAVFAEVTGKKQALHTIERPLSWPDKYIRNSPYLTHPVFNSYHSEHEMLRYIKKLEHKDLSMSHSMIALGSCTMKLNATTEMIPLSWLQLSQIHPFTPIDQTIGYAAFIADLEQYLMGITQFSAISLQPNSGAQGEYTGLMIIRAYHKSRHEAHRNIALIPSSAHGTNPASAVMAGLKVIVVNADSEGKIDIEDLKAKAERHTTSLCCLMITYPSTHGVFEDNITDICNTIHHHGGMVYMDGANMNAQVGLTSPVAIGADVCHLNMHKTFCIPHGGGGPGMGPICVTDTLKPFLPSHPIVKVGGENSIGAVAAAPWGSAYILAISYAYIRMMGEEGLTHATKVAMLNANYIKERIRQHYHILYTGSQGRCAHELIVDCREFKKIGISVEDIAKRLMDYGFHAPTVSFPVPGTLMIEPTESESLAELNRFCDALIAIREEIREIETGKMDEKNNLLKNAPHSALTIADERWDKPYSRRRASYPLPYIEENKFWPPVSRINNAYGDRNLMCTCPPMNFYHSQENDSPS